MRHRVRCPANCFWGGGFCSPQPAATPARLVGIFGCMLVTFCHLKNTRAPTAALATPVSPSRSHPPACWNFGAAFPTAYFGISKRRHSASGLSDHRTGSRRYRWPTCWRPRGNPGRALRSTGAMCRIPRITKPSAFGSACLFGQLSEISCSAILTNFEFPTYFHVCRAARAFVRVIVIVVYIFSLRVTVTLLLPGGYSTGCA